MLCVVLAHPLISLGGCLGVLLALWIGDRINRLTWESPEDLAALQARIEAENAAYLQDIRARAARWKAGDFSQER